MELSGRNKPETKWCEEFVYVGYTLKKNPIRRRYRLQKTQERNTTQRLNSRPIWRSKDITNITKRRISGNTEELTVYNSDAQDILN